jgi:transcriptional regulator with XRE-family HTH domain
LLGNDNKTVSWFCCWRKTTARCSVGGVSDEELPEDEPRWTQREVELRRGLLSIDRYVGPDFDQRVGANVQRYRASKGFSQSDLATAMSEGAEHIHQQTIQKIEKGTRPLKYSEAIRICDVLGISPLHLTDGGELGRANAAFMETTDAFDKLNTELDQLADKLAAHLWDLAEMLGLQSGGAVGYQPDEYLLGWAQRLINTNWGKKLNNRIMQAIREHPYMNTARDDIDAPTYREILKLSVEKDFKPIQPSDPYPTEPREDASET